MPETPKSTAPPGAPPAILVVEEYGALAAAIGSALKKFAPHHRVCLADSLAEATAHASSIQPILFIVDADPPHPGAITFLNQMSREHPGARMLVIAASLGRDLMDEIGAAGALQFIEKPFELADFGASVQALLGPWQASARRARGTLENLQLQDIAHLMCVSRATGVIEAVGRDRKKGEVHVREGQIVHAATSGLVGQEALQALLCWRGARLRERDLSPAGPQTITLPWRHVLLQGLRYAKAATAEEADEELPPAAPPAAKPAPAPKEGRKVVVIDDTDMLRIFVEDLLSTLDPALQITTAPNGAEGVRTVGEILPDLVALDYSLPDFNGDEVCRRLLAEERTARIPIVMMSGHVPQMNATAAKYPNVIASIAKPFHSEQFIPVMEKALRSGPIDPARLAETRPPPAIEPPPAPAPPPAVERREPPPAPPEPPPAPASRTAPAPSHAVTAISPLPAEAEAFPPRGMQPGVVPPPSPSVTPATRVSAPGGRAVSGDHSEVVLGLALEVLSMELTPHLRIGSIRARPAAQDIALRFLSNSMLGGIPAETRFELGPIELDQEGRIATIRVIPTQKTITLPSPRLAFAISDLSVIPANSHNHVKIMSAPTAPMTMQLVAHFELEAVELSPGFQIAALALQGDHDAVRVTLEGKTLTSEENATDFRITQVELDGLSRIAALQLTAKT